MFKKSSDSPQLSLFGRISDFLPEHSRKIYEDESSWHNVFYKEVLCRIDESIFAPLFSDCGAPNASVRVLVGMMILKESCDFSDESLFENVRFNVLYRKALGLYNMDDPVPSLSTYYLLRQRLEHHFHSAHTDLIEECFQRITQAQCKSYKVKGKSIRLDSKLINSNIAQYSRYQLVHSSLEAFLKSVPDRALDALPSASRELLEVYRKEDPSKTTYYATAEEIHAKLQKTGALVYNILELLPEFDTDEYRTLTRVFSDQYCTTDEKQDEQKDGQKNKKDNQQKDEGQKVKQESKQKDGQKNKQESQREDNTQRAKQESKQDDDGQKAKQDEVTQEPSQFPVPKANKDISPTSVQSTHDTECSFRRKNGESVKGYNHNLTETCDKNAPVNLITDVQTQPASAADCDFVERAVQTTSKAVTDTIDAAHADGAYNSSENREYMQKNNIDFHLTGFQGAPARYQFTLNGKELKCTDTQTNQEKEVYKTKKAKYRIKTEKGYRYYTQQAIESQQARREIQQQPKEISNIRNNVEASIFQMALHLRKDKTKYRGLYRNKVWALVRCARINCARITKHIADNVKKTSAVNVFLHLIEPTEIQLGFK